MKETLYRRKIFRNFCYITKASHPYNSLDHKTLNASPLSSLMCAYHRHDVRDPVGVLAAPYQQRRHRHPERVFEVNLLRPDGCTICMLGNPVTAHLSQASGVRGWGFVGARSNESGRKVGVKTLLSIRKTPCAYTQKTLRLYAKSPRLNAKTHGIFSSLSRGLTNHGKRPRNLARLEKHLNTGKLTKARLFVNNVPN